MLTPLTFMPPGSSPLTRGALSPEATPANLAGLIPAHAGSTQLSIFDQDSQSAHPRSRGEHASRARHSRNINGSSPLTRGAPTLCSLAHELGRLIPAHAGSTPLRRFASTRLGAHPRSRGEHVVFSHRRPGSEGSSPLTRGALRRPISGHVGRGAHPRSRGEHLLDQAKKVGEYGSSPLTRGALSSRSGRRSS